ncbi:hypothetical protein [Rahnella sp. ChDrAdgB13]|uniref:hypothetical protein n=1 Tax=Rahnella sp. ChDrAdgB13 TaxID=1850581 RepID=UPI001AD85554|nr:hypothetical protein [Rahnella sp. ChDrAdgB13]
MKNKLEKSEAYSEHYVDFSIVGVSGTQELFCMQFLANKPTPFVENATKDGDDANIQIGVGSILYHECTLYMGKDQLEALYETIGKNLGK